ncbi:MAG TPA: glycosyltransferase [Thermoleophilaceae bacterium]|jgi:UDP-N-acetylglucosamine transferase subunit ALG13
MILFTVGTNEQPFDRLVRAAAELETDEPLFVQHGASLVEHGSGEWVDFLSYEDLTARAHEARVVICHAGVGSIMMARRCGHTPLVVPRRHHLGEAVDDHQLVLARRLDAAGSVVLVEDEQRLARAIASVGLVMRHPASSPLDGARELNADIRSVLTTLGAAELNAGAASAAGRAA